MGTPMWRSRANKAKERKYGQIGLEGTIWECPLIFLVIR